MIREEVHIFERIPFIEWALFKILPGPGDEINVHRGNA